MNRRKYTSEIHQGFDKLLNFITYHHSSGKRPPDERKQLDEAIEFFKESLMKINDALDLALAQANTDKKTISDDGVQIKSLQDQLANASNVDPVKAKALADAVLGVDSATLPDVPAVTQQGI